MTVKNGSWKSGKVSYNNIVSKLDLDYFEKVVCYKALSDSTYLASIVDHIKPVFFKDKNISKVFTIISEFHEKRNKLPTITEVKSYLTTDELKDSFKALVTSFADIDKLNVVSPSVVTAGTKIYYYLKVQNNGPDTSIDALITDNLPTGITNAQYSLNLGNSWDTWTGTRLLSNFTVIPGVNHILIRGDLETSASGLLINSASISSAKTFDNNLGNNAAFVSSTVLGLADLVLTKEQLVAPITIGGPIDYRITVTNNGPSEATGVVITDRKSTRLNSSHAILDI
jgi:uncharacterized repeat protein (TIGR01451 family)